jgi:hypothetical protein
MWWHHEAGHLRQYEGDGVRTIRIGKARIRAEVADSFVALALGVMFRRGLGQDRGVLLKFRRAGNHALHMWFVRFPLDIAFIDEAGTVRKVTQARPWQAPFAPGCRVRYALELPAGYCRANGIGPGMRAAGLPAGRGRIHP